MLLNILLHLAASSALYQGAIAELGLDFTHTRNERVECGTAENGANDLPAQYLASAQDCQSIVDWNHAEKGYWWTSNWADNKANEFVDIDDHEKCAFSVKHQDPKSAQNPMQVDQPFWPGLSGPKLKSRAGFLLISVLSHRVGSADVEDFVKYAMKKTNRDGKVAQWGYFWCHDAEDITRGVNLEWRVWNPPGPAQTPSSSSSSSSSGSRCMVPSWTNLAWTVFLALTLFFASSVSGSTLEWTPTADSQLLCTPKANRGDITDSTPIGSKYLEADRDACRAIVEKYNTENGYFRTYSWVDNKAEKYVHLVAHGGGSGCVISLSHRGATDRYDVMIGNADIVRFITTALGGTGGLAQYAPVSCPDANFSQAQTELYWNVWNSASSSAADVWVAAAVACGLSFWALA